MKIFRLHRLCYQNLGILTYTAYSRCHFIEEIKSRLKRVGFITRIYGIFKVGYQSEYFLTSGIHFWGNFDQNFASTFNSYEQLFVLSAFNNIENRLRRSKNRF